MNKKKLYESIMREVSKQVKNTLNEANELNVDKDGYVKEPKYAAINFTFCRTLIDSDLKEIGKSWEWYKKSLVFVKDNIDDLLNEVKEYLNLNPDIEIYTINDMAYIRVITDKDLHCLNNQQLKAFHNGEIEGYQYEISFYIMKQVMKDDLNYNGLMTI